MGEWITVSHYFDHAATTAIRPAAVAAWQESAALTGNSAASHAAGRAARRVLEESREQILACLGASAATHLVFTSGGTEADNLAIIGLARAQRRADPKRTTVLISPIEHHAVLDAARSLAGEGFTVLEMPLTDRGVVNAAATADLMRLHAGDLAVASLMAVNNETGLVQPAARLAAVAHDELGVPFHCDMVQAHGLGPDLADNTCTAAFTAHKLGGPMGVGALTLPRGTTLDPISFGAGQEARLRSGTVPVALIAAFAAALSHTVAEHEAEQTRLTALSARLATILSSVAAEVVGPVDARTARTEAITYALFPGCSAQDLVVLLDSHQIFVSTGSACTAGVPQPSHVLLAMGYTEDQARSGLRFSLGWTTTDADLDALAATLPAAVNQARRTR